MTKIAAWSVGAWLIGFVVGCGTEPNDNANTDDLLGGSPSNTTAPSADPTDGAGSTTPSGGTGSPANTVSPPVNTDNGSPAGDPSAPLTPQPPPGGGGAPNDPPPVDTSTPPGTGPDNPDLPPVGEPEPGVDEPPIVEPDVPSPVVVDRPALITSAQGAYWQEGELTEMAGGNAELNIDENTTYQEWLGFGGTFNEAGWDVLSLLDPSERDRAIQLLFGAAEGANFAWGRIPMGASDFAMDRYSLSETADDFMMESFSIERDKELLIPYIKAALAVKPDLHLWASPWSPPAWMKDNGDMNGGRIKDDAQVLQAYGLYFARFVEEYANEGMVIEHVQPQNEPGYETRYPSCLWTPELLRNFVRDYLGPTFTERGVEAKIWFGTMSAPEDTQHLDAVMADAEAAKYVSGFGLQWNTIASTQTLSSRYGLPVMQTEHKCGNYPWETATFNPDRPPNDHAYGEESWGLIRDWLQAGVNTYSAWNMVLDTQGQNLDEERPWPQNALLVVDRATNTLTLTPTYYVFRHLSYFVDPGAVRIGTTGTGDALAFKNPDGSIIAVVYNSGAQATAMTLGIGGTVVQFQVPGRGWASVNWE